MKKILLTILLVFSSVWAEVIHEYPNQSHLDSKITIIDIRTEPEWKETGLLVGAIPITFFDNTGNYNVPAFMEELNKHVKEGETFALICHTGSRTAILADFLSEYYKMRVINLRGGMYYAEGKHLKTVPYQGK